MTCLNLAYMLFNDNIYYSVPNPHWTVFKISNFFNQFFLPFFNSKFYKMIQIAHFIIFFFDII